MLNFCLDKGDHHTLPIDPPDTKKALIQNILNTPKSSVNPKDTLQKAAVIIDIMAKVVLPHSSDFLQGAHIIVEDNGSMYDKLKDLGLVKERFSSHHRGNKAESDVSIQAGEIFREFLVGKTKDGKTWFQLEAHSIGGIKNFVKHMVDYITYVLTGKSVGQYGLSEHVDSNPIVLDAKQVNQKTKKQASLTTSNFVKKIEEERHRTKSGLSKNTVER
ncbi:hypothetical protein [Rickettsia endosymbiont of Culicoides newsteadi]|uniref:hypothetical protein n=1 Tax=Rickettsia endosymbiont of Culicoides newsteadi TaxID=1961830 RepID=UPI000B9C2DD5|nr:hypothetical protein [Rickettsia endosymbiont of Culicoides newsteadi]OZG31241.1 hypothetical protein RiCNE_13730 [Rickettsia endosymbiont of Culicoides newsteadi]